MTSTELNSRLNAPKIHHLPNGLTIIAEQMPVEAVNLSLWVKVGSAVEADPINGMTHFLEHMIFKGTQRLLGGEFERRIEERGAVTNAATSQDYTHYYITAAPKDFADLSPLLVDVVMNASIADEAFERERLVVLEEIRRSDDSPGYRTYQRAMETAFEKLPYHRPVLGTETVISQLQAQQMRDYHARWYQPSKITAVAVGNLAPEELIEVVEKEFALVTQNVKTRSRSVPVGIAASERQYNTVWESYTSEQHDVQTSQAEPPFTEIVRQEYVDESLQQARLVMVWRVPGLTQLNQTYALDVIASILGHGRTSRLLWDLREKHQLVSLVGVTNMTHQLQGTFYISAYCKVENLTNVEQAIAQHIHKLQTELVKESEIARIQKRVANKFIFANERPSDRAGLYGYYQTLVGDLEPAFDYPMHIQAQNATTVMQAAQEYLSPDAYGVVVVKPS